MSEERAVKSEESPDPVTFHSSLFTMSAKLRAVAEELVVQSRAASPTRDSALTLLAADALITLAVEAEAVSDIRTLTSDS